MSNRFVSHLHCGHSAHYDPAPHTGDVVYCRRCTKYCTVVTSSAEWNVHCAICAWSRPYGMDKRAAERAASRHVKRLHHTTLIRKGYTTVDTLSVEDGQSTLDFPTTEDEVHRLLTRVKDAVTKP